MALTSERLQMACCGVKDPTKLLPYEAYYKYYSLNRLMRYLAMSLGLLKSYTLVGEGFRFDAFEPFRDALLQTYLLSQNLLERSQKLDPCCNSADATQSNSQAASKDEHLMLSAVERQKLLTCVQCLAGCVEFSGVGDEKRYLEMCTEALTHLREVQAYFNRERFWKPGWMQEEHRNMKNDWEKFEGDLRKIITTAERKNELEKRDNEKKKELINIIEKELDREIACLSGNEKAKKKAARPTNQEIEKMIEQAIEPKQDQNDQELVQSTAQGEEKEEEVASVKKDAERANKKEVARILYLRSWKLENDKEWLEKSKTARASEPRLYRSHGPNSYSASKRPKSANSHQREIDPKPWNAWQVEKSQFLLSASRSIGVLRASSKSEGFRFDAFQPFFGALRDTFDLCDKHLKRNETDEEYLSVSDRNTLLAAIVGLAGCVTFTGVSREEKYGELCKFALEKLEPVVAKLSGAGPLDGAPPQFQQQFQQQFQYQPQQQQQQQYFARQQTPQQQPQYVQSGGYHSPGDYWSRGQEGGQAQGGGYYGQMGWQTPWPWPGQMCQPYTPQPQLQQPPPGHQ